MWYLTMHRWIGDRAEAMALLDDHLGWMREQQLAGTVIAAGPTPDRELGIMLFRNMTRAELDAVCATDPFVQGGHREYEVVPWEVHHLLGVGGFDQPTITAMLVADERAL